MDVYGFGYNGYKQLSAIAGTSVETEKNDTVIATPLVINPYKQSELRRQDTTNSVNVRHVSVTWDSILFIYDDGSYCLSGFRSVYNKMSRLRDVSVTSGSLLWDYMVIVSDQGVCYAAVKSPEPVLEEVKYSEDCTVKDVTTRITSVSSGETCCYALTDSQRVVYLEKSNDSFVFKPVSLLAVIKEVSCGKGHTLMLSKIGILFTSGTGGQGQLGHGDVESREKPSCVEALQCVSVVSVAAGGWHSVALSDLGDLYVWGWNESGQLGFTSKTTRGDDSSEHDSHKHEDYVNILPEPRILDLKDGTELTVSEVSCGSRHTAAITDNGHLYTWGWNKYGQLGHSDTLNRDKPACVKQFVSEQRVVSKVFCGYWNTVILVQSPAVT